MPRSEPMTTRVITYFRQAPLTEATLILGLVQADIRARLHRSAEAKERTANGKASRTVAADRPTTKKKAPPKKKRRPTEGPREEHVGTSL
jgi:hypothetical protein